MAVNGRVYHTTQTHYLRADVAFNSVGLAGGTFKVGTLPAGAVVLRTLVNVSTVFNAGTTNVLIVGTSTNDDAFVDSDDINEASATLQSATTGLGLLTAETEVFAKYSQTGTAATAGAAQIIIEFVVDNDV